MNSILNHSCYSLVTIHPGARHPGRSPDPVHCHLQHARLDQDPQYEALSYVWGDPTNQVFILLGGTRFPVNRSLYGALLRLRREHTQRTLWIDAICINQQDVTERNTQASLMSSIYKTALGVIVWLGEESHLDRRSMHLALEALEKLSSGPLLELRNQISKDGLKDNTNSMIYDILKNELQTFSSPFSKHARVWKIIRAFLAQAWFHRAWILQEVVLSMKSTSMQCGAVCIEFAILRQACHTVEAFGLAPSLASTGKEDDLVRHMGRLQDYVRNNPSHHDLKLFSLLSARRSCLATDPRDKVFALIGLANDAQDLSPDYSKSVKEVYSQTAEHILYVNNNIGLLNEVKSLQLGSELPSWVPDWSVCPKVMLLASTNSNGTKRYRASGTSYPSFTIATKEKLLSIRGVSFDKVSQHLGRYSTISEGKNYVPEIGLIDYRTGLWAEMARSVYPDGIYGPTKEPLVQVYDRVLTCDQSIVSKRLDREAETAYYPETLAFIDAIRSENEHPLFPQAFKRMKDLDIDLEAAIKNNTRGPEIYAMEDVVKYLDRLPGMEDVIENIPEDVFRYVLSELTSAKIAFTEGRRLFISVSGHMGLCPSATEPEDVICILFGADIPFVLRPLQNGNYLLVGECYIDGFMDGEGLLQIVEGPGLGGLSEKLRASTQEFVLQ